MTVQQEQKEIQNAIQQAQKAYCPEDLEPAVVKTYQSKGPKTIGLIFLKKGVYSKGSCVTLHDNSLEEVIQMPARSG